MGGVVSLLRFRVINRILGTVITDDLPHLHSSSWHVVGYQPGNPSNSAVGTFSIPLHPPGSEGYAAAKPIYDQLARYLRVEAYISHDGTSLGKLFQAGPITGIDKQYGETSLFTLTGSLDTQWANLSRPFPGELLPGTVTSTLIKNYLGTNEAGWTDNFTPFTAGNYNSSNIPGLTSGTWTGTTDDGLNVVTCSTGSGAALISKSGAVANDNYLQHYVEATGRINGGGAIAVGLTNSPTDCTTSCAVWVTSILLNGRYNLLVRIVIYNASAQTVAAYQNALVAVDDPQGMVPFTAGILSTNYTPIGVHGQVVTVNGKVILTHSGNYAPTASTCYPFLGRLGGTVYMTNLVQMTRFTTDGASTAAAFGNGTISTTTNALGAGTDPGSTFLDVWASCATRENFYLRYTPQPYVIGSRTLGTVDFAADPGTDLGTTKQVVFSRDAGNLVSLQLSNNADPLSSGGIATGLSTPNGGGLGFWRDIGAMTKYGIIEDQNLAAIVPDFNSLRRSAAQIWANKVAIDTAGAKTALVLRDPDTADKWRELDKVMVHEPELNVFYQVARVLAYTFDEGLPTQSVVLDQFGEEFTGLPHANPHATTGA